MPSPTIAIAPAVTTEPVVHKIIVAHEFPMALPLALRIEEGLLQASGRNKVKPKKHRRVVVEDTAAVSDAPEDGGEHGNEDEKVNDEAADHWPTAEETAEHWPAAADQAQPEQQHDWETQPAQDPSAQVPWDEEPAQLAQSSWEASQQLSAILPGGDGNGDDDLGDDDGLADDAEDEEGQDDVLGDDGGHDDEDMEGEHR